MPTLWKAFFEMSELFPVVGDAADYNVFAVVDVATLCFCCDGFPVADDVVVPVADCSCCNFMDWREVAGSSSSTGRSPALPLISVEARCS